MSLLTGILVLVLVCAASVSLAAATGRDAAVFPLPIFAGAVCLLLAGGCLGMLQWALWLCYLLLLAGAAALGLRAGRARWLAAASSTGLLFFAAASLVIWVLFAVLQPMFVEWDEFTFWGMAAKLLKEKILSRKFRYDENLMLEINFQNARCTEDTNRNKYVNKKRSAGKVDMVVAVINATYLAEQDMLFGTDDFVVQT